MTQKSYPYNNGVYGKINGILKQEFNISKNNNDLLIMKQVIKETVALCNEKRPHSSNQMLKPNQAQVQSKFIMKTSKTKNSTKNIF